MVQPAAVDQHDTGVDRPRSQIPVSKRHVEVGGEDRIQAPLDQDIGIEEDHVGVDHCQELGLSVGAARLGAVASTSRTTTSISSPSRNRVRWSVRTTQRHPGCNRAAERNMVRCWRTTSNGVTDGTAAPDPMQGFGAQVDVTNATKVMSIAGRMSSAFLALPRCTPVGPSLARDAQVSIEAIPPRGLGPAVSGPQRRAQRRLAIELLFVHRSSTWPKGRSPTTPSGCSPPRTLMRLT